MKKTYGITTKEGLVITSIDKNSSAEIEGLRKGDVITMVNLKKEMLKSPASLDKYLKSRKDINQGRIVIGIERGGALNFVELRASK